MAPWNRSQHRWRNPLALLSHAPRRARAAPWPWLVIGSVLVVLLSAFTFARISHSSASALLQKLKPAPFAASPPPPPSPPPAEPDYARPWEKYPLLHRYWGGLRRLQPSTPDRAVEYPHLGDEPALDLESSSGIHHGTASPSPFRYDARQVTAGLPGFQSAGTPQLCYLDAQESVPVPSLQAYRGLVEGFPDPIAGGYAALGLPNDVCFDRYGRLGPYGYGYSTSEGGVGGTAAAELDGASAERQRQGRQRKTAEPAINYDDINWAGAQERCYARNRGRFAAEAETAQDNWEVLREATANATTAAPAPADFALPAGGVARTAVVFRVWGEYEWTAEAVVRMRSLIAELALYSGGEYQVHFLVHIKDESLGIWESEAAYAAVLAAKLPREFRGMGMLWSEARMARFYPGLQETWAAGLPVHGVYRSAHFALQFFAHLHPEYAFVWNWEMDIRATGHWYVALEALRSFARRQPRKGLWERNARFYVPSVHGSWAAFGRLVAARTAAPAPDGAAGGGVMEPTVWGPLLAAERRFPSDPVPPHAHTADAGEGTDAWGVDEEADLITLNPIFDPVDTAWVLQGDVTGYGEPKPPRRTAIVTAARLSRRLLATMHAETALRKHTMFTEMWPATVCLHHGLKAVYAPHPLFEDRAWPPATWEARFNGGYNGAAGGGPDSLFGIELDRHFYGTTWYFHAKFSQTLWRRWLGLEVAGAGGLDDEHRREGRMCLPPILLHPVKPITEGFPV